MKRIWLLLCIVYVASSPLWGPAAEAAFRLERADGSRPTKGLNLAPYVRGGVTFGKPVGTLRPPPAPKVAQVAYKPAGSVWDRLRACESPDGRSSASGRYHGFFQFDQQTWGSVGGSGNPGAASYDEQLKRAKMLQARRGWGPWPACSRKLGLR